jgi:hypothetical protein
VSQTISKNIIFVGGLVSQPPLKLQSHIRNASKNTVVSKNRFQEG